MARSLRASEAGIKKAEEAFKLKGWTQDHLAGRADCTRQVVINFFAKRPVEKKLFQNICSELNLEWGEIAELEPGEEETGKTVDINDLVKTARENIRDSIDKRCSTMRVLDMNQPIGLDDIYTSVNILEKITGRRRLEIAELLQGLSIENFERFSLGDVREKRVPDLDAVNKHSKLMILGKPGAGKTTFLKYLALQCIEGRFQANHIPLFITLKEFAELPNQPNLLEYLIQLFASLGIAPNTKIKTGFLASFLNRTTTDTNQLVDLTAVEQLLNQGKLLILLDGLDEVREADNKRVLSHIRDFTIQYHKNQFVISCRIAAREYTFEQFTEVEVADFDEQQIHSFAQKWFKAKDDVIKAERFTEKLKDDKPIQELATNPLLLTLLCLVFEESGNFPSNRSELYKESLDVLLKKWDVKRNIERDQVYKELSLKRKEDLLSRIALETFKRGDYFFKQKEIEREITQYIQNLPNASTNPEALQLDSEAVLKSIEAQHGLFVERARSIYSFSHLTFHEYFTARKLVTSANPYATNDKALQALTTHLTEKRWREVFLLTVGMLDSADALLQLMKNTIDALLEKDEKLQEFFAWVEQKSSSVETSYKPAAVRSFYVYLARGRGRAQDRALNRALNLALYLNLALDLDLALNLALNRARALNRALNRARALNLVRDLARALNLARDLAQALNLARDRNLKLQQLLQQLENQLPKHKNDLEAYVSWWQAESQAWTQQLRTVMIEYRNIGHDWQFSDSQKKLLIQYLDANKLLVDCLNSDCYVSRKVRQEIEDTLLLPVKK
ncbi:signal transduction protein [Brasilonema sennae CENA114]|uniref:Signal transduction protein n=1 Tax=Brasilonema sennae CENA114 TaxID=415709 RepID=A0A856MNB9_9CYAN|nr:NACHT domain-containing NTPase [Brasilonema sennae]QDL11580.1 signal transduction protein [Brasilonema sennae CENA114]